MFKQVSMIALSSLMFSATVVHAHDTETLVEVMLVDKLDDSRGYCLDIAGGKGARAPLDKGLQAHTCYHYTGGILEDQGFDAVLLAKGQFRIPYFDVCMTASSLKVGSSIELAKCSDSDTQQFVLTDKGQIQARKAAQLCVTVNSTEKREGRGGSPVHVMRPLSLQTCADDTQAYQTWSLYSL